MNLEILKKAKKSLGITFDELAEKTNISVSTLTDILLSYDNGITPNVPQKNVI